MAGYVLLLVSFPVTMTRWLPPEVVSGQPLSLADSLHIIFSGMPPLGQTWDAISSATPLDQMRSELSQNRMISEIRQSPLWGDFGGRGWEWIGNWFLLGGLFLIWQRVISWRIPVTHARRPAADRRPVLGDRPGDTSVPGVPPVQRRRHPRRVLHRHRPGIGQHDRRAAN